MAGAGLRLAARIGTAKGQESDLRRETFAESGAGDVQPCAWRPAERLAGTYADYRILFLRCARGERSAAAEARKVLERGRCAGGVHSGVGGGAGCGRFL